MVGEKNNWFVYVIQCSDKSLYTGITTNVERRYQEHQSSTVSGTGSKGAKYFRGRSPQKIVYRESGHTRATASQREYAIKQYSKEEKLALLGAPTNELLEK